LKEPLERYHEFVRCNYFGNADRPGTEADEDDGGWTGTDSLANKTQQEDERLLQRPREERLRITPSYYQLFE